MAKLTSTKIRPFVKWVGGKRTLVEEIQTLTANIWDNIECYHEPFVGGGAVFLGLQPKRAVINDLNENLIMTYRAIKEDPEKLFELVCAKENTKEFFLKERMKDRKPSFATLNKFERAARLLYLNKTCFNGLWRENSKGYYNVPFANNGMEPERFLNLDNAKNVSQYLNSNDIQIVNESYTDALSKVKLDDLVYLDPPYMPLSETSSFTSYTKYSFGWNEQKRLKDVCDEINDKKAFFILSNSNHPGIVELYKDYSQNEVGMRRSINSKGNSRGKIKELLITNIPG